MSVGHHHPKPSEKHYRELTRISQQPWFKRGVAIPKQVSRRSEIPWLGGSNTALTRIYVDPRFAGTASYLGKPINIASLIPAVVQHEGVEGILLVFGTDEAGKSYDYDGAHELATAAEELKAEKIIRGLGLKWDRDAYQEIFKPFLKLTIMPPWKNIPGDLNTEPYRQDAPDLYREIEREILRQQVSA